MSVLDTAYRRMARPVLFRIGRGDPESAHHATLEALRRVTGLPPATTAMSLLLRRHQAARTVFGVDFPSPIGVAAGLDKDGRAAQAWPALGFGFVEFGTVTAQPQPGNDRPRLFRLSASEALINRMGFNNAGAEALARTLEQAGPLGVPVGISLGKSRSTPVEQAVPDYLTSLRAVHRHADYIAVNVSSPNTPGLRTLQERGPLGELLGALTGSAAALAGGRRPLPVLVKIAPDLTDFAIAELLQVCQEQGIAGVIATNTTLERSGLQPSDQQAAVQTGGLSGAPLRRRALEVVRFVAAHTTLPVIGVGGISTAEHGMAMMDAGAALLQLYTGFIYAGPALVADLNKAATARDRRPYLTGPGR